jgi:hypothetical protein
VGVAAVLFFCYYRQSWTAMVGSDGRVAVRQISVNQGTLVHPIGWGFRRSWYNPRLQQPDFIVTSDNRSLGWADVKRVAIKTYGPPVRTIQDGNLMALVWGTNLLPGLR